MNPVMHESDGVSLKEYIDRLWEEQARHSDKSDAMLNARLMGMNEIRDQLRDQAASFLTRKEYDAKHEAICNLISDIKSRVDMSEGKASQSSFIVTLILSISGVVLGLIHLFLK
jgi:hypothetical protein